MYPTTLLNKNLEFPCWPQPLLKRPSPGDTETQIEHAMVDRYIKARLRLDSRGIFLTLFAPNVAPPANHDPQQGPKLAFITICCWSLPTVQREPSARQEVFWKNNSLTAVFFSGLGWALLQILFPFWALTAKSIVTFSCRPGGWEGRLAVYMCWATIRRFCLGPVKLKQHYLTD